MDKVLKVTNKDELAYVMAYYGIDNIPISMAMAKVGYVFSTHKYALPVGKVIRKGNEVTFVQDICARNVPVEPAIRHAFSVVNDVVDAVGNKDFAFLFKNPDFDKESTITSAYKTLEEYVKECRELMDRN